MWITKCAPHIPSVNNNIVEGVIGTPPVYHLCKFVPSNFFLMAITPQNKWSQIIVAGFVGLPCPLLNNGFFRERTNCCGQKTNSARNSRTKRLPVSNLRAHLAEERGVPEGGFHHKKEGQWATQNGGVFISYSKAAEHQNMREFEARRTLSGSREEVELQRAHNSAPHKRRNDVAASTDGKSEGEHGRSDLKAAALRKIDADCDWQAEEEVSRRNQLRPQESSPVRSQSKPSAAGAEEGLEEAAAEEDGCELQPQRPRTVWCKSTRHGGAFARGRSRFQVQRRHASCSRNSRRRCTRAWSEGAHYSLYAAHRVETGDYGLRASESRGSSEGCFQRSGHRAVSVSRKPPQHHWRLSTLQPRLLNPRRRLVPPISIGDFRDQHAEQQQHGSVHEVDSTALEQPEVPADGCRHGRQTRCSSPHDRRQQGCFVMLGDG